MLHGIVAYDVDPLLLTLGPRFEKFSRQIAGNVCLSGNRLAPPGEVIRHPALGDTMGEDHRDWRFGALVTGEDQQVRRFGEVLLDSFGQPGAFGRREPAFHRLIGFEAENGDPLILKTGNRA